MATVGVRGCSIGSVDSQNLTAKQRVLQVDVALGLHDGVVHLDEGFGEDT